MEQDGRTKPVHDVHGRDEAPHGNLAGDVIARQGGASDDEAGRVHQGDQQGDVQYPCRHRFQMFSQQTRVLS